MTGPVEWQAFALAHPLNRANDVAVGAFGCGGRVVCRADVSADAAEPLTVLMLRIRDVLADRSGVDPESVVVGPIDFGFPDQ